MADKGLDLSGVWRCAYWFPSNDWIGDDVSEYRMKAYPKGDTIVFESEPNDEGSYMLVRLKIEDGIATGSWHETTSPTGSFKGAMYSGYGQLIVNIETNSMEGKWAGAGYDRKLKMMRIYDGIWTMNREREA